MVQNSFWCHKFSKMTNMDYQNMVFNICSKFSDIKNKTQKTHVRVVKDTWNMSKTMSIRFLTNVDLLLMYESKIVNNWKFRTVYPNLIFATFADLQPVWGWHPTLEAGNLKDYRDLGKTWGWLLTYHSKVFVGNLETLYVEWQRILSAKTEYNCELLWTTFMTKF